MTPQQMIFRISKSIAGAILIGLGTFILYENVAGAVTRLSHILGANGSQVLGVLPAAFLAFSQAVQTFALDHHRFLQGLFQQTLVSSWPLLLVIFGTVLSKDTLADESHHVEDKSAGPVDLPCPCPTYRFTRSRPTASSGSNLREL
jgi:hypothetical protein